MSIIELQKGDNDKNKTWGGKKRESAPSYKVSNLQTDLKKVGIHIGKIDGDYGSATSKSLKIFQWACVTSGSEINNTIVLQSFA